MVNSIRLTDFSAARHTELTYFELRRRSRRTMKVAKSNTAFIWLVFCAVSLHMNLVSSEVRKHYIAAVERKWNYAPSGYNNVKGLKLDEDR